MSSSSSESSASSGVVDLEIVGFSQEQEDTEGAFVDVGRPRKKIILRCTESSGNVTLTRNNDKIRIFNELWWGSEIPRTGFIT